MLIIYFRKMFAFRPSDIFSKPVNLPDIRFPGIQYFSFRRVAIGIGILLFFLIYTGLKPEKQKRWYYYNAPCSYPSEQVNASIELAIKVDQLLERQKIAHVLCYGSLWGALRREDMLPWDDDIDFCIWNEDVQKLDEAYLYRLFQKEGMILTYDTTYGEYTVYYKTARAELVVFELSDDYIWLQGVGLRNRMRSSESREKFPSRLIAPPVPKHKFHGYDMPIPRGETEIQKYFYPNDYWQEVRPPNCA